jgi:hypothetical protein
MATPVNQGTNRTIIDDGAAITSTDLTSIGKFSSQRAWDAPGYAGLLAFDLVNSLYGDVTSGVAAASGLTSGVFTVGGGLVANSIGLLSGAGPGFIGIWDETRALPPLANDSTPRMSWAWVGNSDVAHTHAAASAGNTRYDLVHCAIARTNLSEARDFKDEATGERTTQTPVIAEQIAVDIQVTQGSQSTGTPTLPALPTGRHALYAVRVSDTAITEVHDFAIPVGTLKTVETNPGGHIFLANTGGWANAGGGVASSGAGYCYISPPDGLRGNPNARLLGVRIYHALKTGDTIDLADYPLGVAGGGTLFGLSSQTTINNSVHDSLIDLRGWPAATWKWTPTRGQGSTNRNGNAHHILALKATAAGAGSVIYGVTWYFIEG